jgi:hypothetical protein
MGVNNTGKPLPGKLPRGEYQNEVARTLTAQAAGLDACRLRKSDKP